MGKKRKKVVLCDLCEKAKHPAISAAKLGHESCLITAYRDLGVFNERDDYGATPIHYAARNGRADCLEWLVKYSGISPNAVAHNGATAAHDAAAVGHLDCLQFLLQHTHCSARDKTVEGASVLHIACRFGRGEVVRWLLNQGDSSSVDKGANNVTPVHLAAAKNHLECLKLLTTHSGYIPNIKTVHGATPIYFSAQEGSLECLQWLFKEGRGDLFMTAEDGMGPIHAAAQAGQLRCLVWMVEVAGISPNHQAKDGATPAHFAAASGQVGCLEWILDNGGSAKDRDNLGGTPVHDAAEQGQVEALTVLIKRGVNVGMEDYDGLKPFDLAKDNKHQECMKLLFKAINTNLLISLTPHHSLSRASQCSDDDDDNDRAANRLEKQRLFEEAMLAGISEERQEALWESAQQNQVMRTQPGLRMLLQGEIPPAASEVSLGDMPPAQAPLDKSLQRRSYRSHGSLSVHRSSLGSDLFRDHPTKIRPALDPSIFSPDRNVAEASPIHKRSKTKASEVQVITKPAVSPPLLQSPPLQAPNRLSFLKRLKFKRKFVSPQSGKSKKKGKAKSKVDKHFKVELEESLQEIESLSDEGDLPPESLELTKPSLYEQVLTLPQGSLEDLNAPTVVMAEVVVHERSDTQYQQNHEPGLAEDTIISSTRGTDHNQSPYEEVAVTFSTKLPESKMSLLSTKQQNPSSTDSSDTELGEGRIDEESSSEEEIDKDAFDKFGQSLNGETRINHAGEGTQSVHRDTVEHSGTLEVAEVASTGSDDTVVIREDPNDSPIIKPSGRHDLLKEAAAVMSDRIKKESQGPDEVVMELRGLSEAGGVQKLINQMKGSGKDDVEDATTNTAASPQDREVFKRGGVNEKLRLFGEKHDDSPTKSSDSEEEEEDTISPLPAIKQGIVHSHSQERLRIDGRSPELARKANSPSLASPQEKRKAVKSLVNSVQAAHSTSLESPSRVRKMAAVYSPLLVSNDVQTVGEASSKVEQAEDTSSREEAGSHTLTLYMNSANMPHIKHARQQQEMAEREQVEQQVNALLEEPQLTGDAVPAVYQHLDLSAGLLTVWKIMDDGSVEILTTEEKFATSHSYICLEVSHYGPVLYHIHQWIGEQTSTAIHSSLDTQCDMLYMCLPGRPVIHRHYEGHETQHFIDLYGSLLERSTIGQSSKCAYYNESVKMATLYKWCEGSFVAEEVVSESVLQQSDVCVLDTANSVWVWLSGDYSRAEQPTPFTIVNEFLKQQEYPQYTPAIVLTEHAETQEFCDQFPLWTHHDLLTSSRAADLRLEARNYDQSLAVPVGQTKVWSVSATGDKHPVPLDLFGHFFSDQTYLITFSASQHKTTSVYVWIGSNVWKRQEAISSSLSKHYCKETSGEVVVVPESTEPAELLSLFKGKFIVHKTTLMAKPTHLYCISGEKSLQMKAAEVLPQSSSLSTSHCFLLKTTNNVYAWSGQYSSSTERRAALLIAKVVRNRELTVICEGLEPPEFWAELGGKQPYTHYEKTKVKMEQYSMYYYNVTSSFPVWCPVPRSHRMRDKYQCYLVCCGDQLVLRVSEKVLNSLQRTATAIIEEFISQYHSHKSLTSFVITLSSPDGKEGGGYGQTRIKAAQQTAQQHVYQFVHTVKKDQCANQSADDSKPQQAEEEMVILRNVPATRPLPLTMSQEEVFANVQRLQAALEESMHQQPDHINQQLDRSSKLRTSAAMEQLHHMIEDLDSMRHTATTSQSSTLSNTTNQLTTPTTPKQLSATTITIQTPLLNGSVVTAVQTSPPVKIAHEAAKSLPVSPRKGKSRQEKDTTQKLIRVNVVMEENGEKVELQVREDAPAITIIFRALDKMGLQPRVEHALFEVCAHLNIERALEDHESVADVMSYWPSKLRPQLVVKTFPVKYLVWDANPPITKESITKFLDEGHVPEITTKLHYCKKPKTMTKWVEGPFCLGTLGMYAISEAKRASRLDLLASTDHRLYTSVQQPVVTSGKTQPPPSPHCFIMKSIDSWKQKDLKIFCAADEATLNMWITALRLVKYGGQLKRNYLAMRKRIQKMAQQDSITH